MMEKFRKIMRRGDREQGSADMIVTLATIPFAIFLILALLDISLFLNTRSHVEASVRDGVRQAAMWGGAGGPSQVRLNTSGQETQKNIKDRLWEGSDSAGTCTHSHCVKAPVISCPLKVASNAGQKITCTATYYYSSIVPGAELLGFGAITNEPYTVTESAISETGYR